MKLKDFVILLVIFLVYAVIVIKFNIVIPCVFYTVTGLYCPGCGITRLCLSLLKGDLYQSFRYNPIIFIDLPILFILFVLNLLYKDKENLKKINNIIIIVLAIITVAYGILRNIPAFDFLAPTQLR